MVNLVMYSYPIISIMVVTHSDVIAVNLSVSVSVHFVHSFNGYTFAGRLVA